MTNKDIINTLNLILNMVTETNANVNILDKRLTSLETEVKEVKEEIEKVNTKFDDHIQKYHSQS